MTKQRFEKDSIVVVEVENVHEKYTGKLIGRNFASEYVLHKDEEESLYLRIKGTATYESSGKITLTVSFECKPIGLKETVVFSVSKELESVGWKDLVKTISFLAIGKSLEVIQIIKEYE